MVMVQDNKISTDLYCKPTDTHQYSHYGSRHPRHVKKGIPYGQALRVKQICSTGSYRDRLRDLRSNFIKRGFEEILVDSGFVRTDLRPGIVSFVKTLIEEIIKEIRDCH